MPRPNRSFLSTLPAFALVAALAPTPPAQAQVSSNLDALGPPAAQKPKAAAPAASKHAGKSNPPRRASHANTAAAGASPHKAAAAPAGNLRSPPPVPDHPPPPVVIPPPAVSVPLHPPAPPPAITATAKATGKAEAMPEDGLRIGFGADSADLNQGMIDALHGFAHHLLDNPRQRVSILSYAQGSTDDLSTPRRLSLARALNARAILINDGVAPTRIYPRPIGLPPKTGPDAAAPADRIDLTLAGPPGLPPPAAPDHAAPAQKGSAP